MDCEELLGFTIIREQLATHCSSAIAKEMALQLSIMTDESAIADSLAETAEAMTSWNTEVEQPLGGTRDIRMTLTKAQKGAILTREELWDVFVSIDGYRRVKRFFDEKYLYYPLLSLWTQDMTNLDDMERKGRSVFDQKGQILDYATPKLARLRQSIHATKERLKRELQGILTNKDNHKYFQEAIVTQRNGRYVIPVKQEYRYVFDGIVHDKSATGATLYIEPMLMVTLNNDLQEAIVEEEREVARILGELSAYLKQHHDRLQDACRRVAHVEFVYGKAAYALTYQGIVPKRSNDRRVILRRGRHPLLPKKKVVPTTIILGEDYQILLITGSNTGGKTVSLKTMGLLAMMHQSGLCIPAEEGTTLPIFKGIYADIGDEQSLEENLSTFSGHMTQLKRIMEVAGPEDLVLIDELGSGTDPEEGSALAVAIMDYFRQLGPLMMVTTHYNDLKNYAYDTEGIENAHVEFDEETLRPTYKLRIGVAGSSHALSIASRLGLPECIITMAKEHKSGSRHSDMEEILSRLNEQLRVAESKEEKLQKELAEAHRMHEQARRELRRVEDKKKAILEKAKDDAYNLKRNLRQESELIIKELKAQFAEQDGKKRMQTIQDVRQLVNELPVPTVVEKRKKIKADQIQVGDRVYVNTLEAVGTVLSCDGKRLQVDVNGLQAMVKLSDISQATPEEARQVRQQEKHDSKVGRRMAKRQSHVYRQQAVSTEINILGQTVDEAIVSVGRFLDQALLAGLSSVKIIHGKGTGALRAGVHDYLRTLSMVKRFEQAAYDDGGAGATNVYFK